MAYLAVRSYLDELVQASYTIYTNLATGMALPSDSIVYLFYTT